MFIRKKNQNSSYRALNELISSKMKLGQFSDCLPLMHPELSLEELDRDNVDQLIHQLHLARLIAAEGLYTTPKRIVKKVIQKFDLNHTRNNDDVLKVIYSASVVYSIINDSESIRDLLETHFKAQEATRFELLLELMLLQAGVNSGRTAFDSKLQQQFLKLIEKSDDEPLVAKHAESLYFHNLYESGQIQAGDLLQRIQIRTDEALAAIDLTWVQLKARVLAQERNVQALSLFTLSQDLNPYFLIESLFYQLHFNLKNLSVAETVTLHCNSGFNVYSRSCGCRFRGELKLFRPSYLRQIVSQDSIAKLHQQFDCWCMSQKNFKFARYRELDFSDNHLDLFAGFYQVDNRKQILSFVRANALISIISGGVLGVTESLIAERCYPNEEYNFLSVRLRVRDLITQLQKSGFPIERKNSRIFWKFDLMKFEVILPLDLTYHGLAKRMQRNYSAFNREQVSREFAITARSANNLMSQWLKLNLISKDNKKNGIYFFDAGS